MRQKIDFGKWAAIAVCAGAVWIFLRYAASAILSALLPFLLSAALVALLSPLAQRLSRFLRVGETVCSVILFFLSIALVLLFGGFAVSRLLREAQGLVARLLTDIGSPSSALSDAIDALRLPETEESEIFRAHLKTMLTDFAKNLLGTLSARLPQWAAKSVAGIPSAILFVVVTVLAGLRFCTNGRQLRNVFLSRLPAQWRQKMHLENWLRLFRGYLRAYLLLFLLTFLELLVGFLILGLDYTVLPALLVALVDILPVLGVGTVLIPWAILELLCHRFYLGFGLVILWLAVTVVRQAVEPHLVGKTLGIPPFLSLAASYIAFKLTGVVGLLLGPPLAVLFQALFKSRENLSE